MKQEKFYEELADITSFIHTVLVRKQSSLLIKGKIGLAQIVVVDILRKNGELKMSDMAKTLGVTKSAVTGMTDRLIRDGFLKRERSQSDRRIVWLKLTEKGNSLSRKLVKNKLDIMRSFFADINKKDRSIYLKIIRKIKGSLEQRMK